MIEYSSFNIDPSYENSFLHVKECFGWQLVGSNEVYNENTYISGIKTTTYGDGFIGGFMSGLTGSDGKIEVSTQTDVTNYIHIILARDTDMPNYEELCDNEDAFLRYSRATMPDKPIKTTLVCALATLIIVISVVMAIINGTAAQMWEIAVCVVVPVAAALIMFFMWRRYKNNRNIYYYAMRKANDLLDESRELVFGK